MSAIVQVPHPVLRQPTSHVTQLDSRVLNIISDMHATLLAAKDPEGVGLAAPQIGVSLRIFLIRPLPDKTITVFINPEITRYSQRQQSPNNKKGVFEGCLSLPHHYAPLTRSLSVTAKYQTLSSPLKSNPPPTLVDKQANFTGFPAHVIQHEMDHLNGILFIDRVLEQNTKLYKAQGQTWHEISL